MAITLEPHGTFYIHMHPNILESLACEPTCIMIDMDLLSNCPACCGQILSSHPGIQNGGEGLRSIILACQGLLVKMLITLEPHVVYSNPNLQLRLFCVRQSAYISAYGSIMLKSLGPAFVWNLFQNSYVETLSSATSVGPCVEIWAPVCTFW